METKTQDAWPLPSCLGRPGRTGRWVLLLSLRLCCALQHWGQEAMFTHVYICRTHTILRKNKINIVCLNNAECLLFQEFGGGGGWAVKSAVVSSSGWSCVWSIYCWIESPCAYLDTFWDYLFTWVNSCNLIVLSDRGRLVGLHPIRSCGVFLCWAAHLSLISASGQMKASRKQLISSSFEIHLSLLPFVLGGISNTVSS